MRLHRVREQQRECAAGKPSRGIKLESQEVLLRWTAAVADGHCFEEAVGCSRHAGKDDGEGCRAKTPYVQRACQACALLTGSREHEA